MSQEEGPNEGSNRYGMMFDFHSVFPYYCFITIPRDLLRCG
jgi:hypothetical protein